MSSLRRLVPRGDPSDVLDALQRHLVLVEIAPPDPPGSPLALRFGPTTEAEPWVAYIIDQLVSVNYLIVDRRRADSELRAALSPLSFLDADDLSREEATDPADEAEIVLLLGLTAEPPWADDVRNRVAAAAGSPHEGVRAAAGLAIRYRDAL